jgi:hypothetical protein
VEEAVDTGGVAALEWASTGGLQVVLIPEDFAVLACVVETEEESDSVKDAAWKPRDTWAEEASSLTSSHITPNHLVDHKSQITRDGMQGDRSWIGDRSKLKGLAMVTFPQWRGKQEHLYFISIGRVRSARARKRLRLLDDNRAHF